MSFKLQCLSIVKNKFSFAMMDIVKEVKNLLLSNSLNFKQEMKKIIVKITLKILTDGIIHL